MGIINVIIVVVSIIAAILMAIEATDSWFSRFFGVFIALVMGFLAGAMFAFLTSLIVSLFAPVEYNVTKVETLVSIKDGNSLEGRFYLGSGYIGDTMQYTYITNDNQEMNMKSVDIDEATLIYSNDLKVETFSPIFKSNVVSIMFGEPVLYYEKYKIYVPEGSIKTEYTIDMQ